MIQMDGNEFTPNIGLINFKTVVFEIVFDSYVIKDC